MTCGTMGETFRRRLANDPYFSIKIQEPEKLCPYSNIILDEQNPDSVDHESMIKAMNTEEFRAHVREAVKLQEEDDQNQKEKNKKKKKLLVTND